MEQYNIKTEQFEGPLDILLQLIEEKKLSINEVSLAEVSSQYLERMKSMPDMSRGEAASFLVIASTLMLIKSKSLLPTIDLSEEEKESVEDLERRLKLYKKLRELSTNIRSSYGNNVIFTRETLAGIQIDFIEPKKVDVGVLHSTIKRIIEVLPVKEILPEKVIEKIIKIEDKMQELSERIMRAANLSFNDFVSKGDKKALVVSFLAMLELMKQGLIAVKQSQDFGEIEITKNSV